MNKPIKLTFNTVDQSDKEALCNFIMTNDQWSKGPETIGFEGEFSKYLGAKNSVFCNSGSSAILLMLQTLLVSKQLKNKKVVLSACSWSTDLSSIMQLGLEPILCDVNDKDLSVSLSELENIFIQEKPACLLLVSALGLVPQMDAIVELTSKYGVVLIEDVCESLASSFDGKKLGTFGLMSCFSFFYSHHFTTIEGGMVCVNENKGYDDEEVYQTLLSVRSHGWTRDNSDEYKKKMKTKWNTDDFNEMYTFYNSGFNLRSTDLQAFLGRRQLKKVDDMCKVRYENYLIYKKNLKTKWLPVEYENTFTSNFCFPIIHERRDEIVKDLVANNIECRPLIAGNLGVHPYYVDVYGRLDLPNASLIHQMGLYLPNNHNISEEEIIRICDIINKYCDEDQSKES